MRNKIHGIALSNRYKLINEWVIVVMVEPKEIIYHSCNPLTLFSYQNLPPPLYFDSVKCIRLPESPLPPRIYPPFQQLYVTLPESTPHSQNIPSVSTTICDPPRIYPSLPEYTLHFNNYMRPSHNLPLPLRIYPPPLPTTIILCCDPPRIYPSLPEFTPFQTNLYVRPSQNLPPPLPEYTPISSNFMRPSQNLPLPPGIYPPFTQLHVTLP